MEAVNEFTQRMAKVIEETRASLELAAEDMARYYDAHHGVAEQFEVGDKVWLDSRNIKTTRPTKKLDDRWYGPFPIEKVLSRNAYKLKLTKAFAKLHPVFHVSRLRKWTADEVAERPRSLRPEPELVDDELEYEVEEILNSRFVRGRVEYLVKFKGYGPEENEWLPPENISAPQFIADFHRQNPSAPRRVSREVMQALMFRKYENLTQPHPNPPPILDISACSSRRRALKGG